jgi:hypothetical protein
MTRKLLLSLAFASISFGLAAQTLPENYFSKLNKNCEKASFMKRVGFFAGRMTANVLFKQGKNEIYRKEQSWNLYNLSVEIANLSLVYNEADPTTGFVYSTDFKTIIDFLPNWKRNLKLARPNSQVGGYTLADLELDSDLENAINQKISPLIEEMNTYYLNSMSLINESKESKNNLIVQDFQSRYLNHFSTLEEKTKEFKNQLDGIFALIQQFQKNVYDAEKILVAQKEQNLNEELALKKQNEKEAADLKAKNRKKLLERVTKYLETNKFSIPFTVQLTKYTKECKHCGQQCEITEPKVNEPNCGDDKTCRDAWIELVGLDPVLTQYFAKSFTGTTIGSCPDSNCPERSNGNNHVWFQIDKNQVVQNWLYTQKGCVKQ